MAQVRAAAPRAARPAAVPRNPPVAAGTDHRRRRRRDAAARLGRLHHDLATRASAVSADGELGAAQLPVKVFQHFFVDLDLPVSLTRGDEVGVPVVVYNYLDKPQTVTLDPAATRRSGSLGWTAPNSELNLGPHEVRSVRYRLKVEKVGAWTLTRHGAGRRRRRRRASGRSRCVPDGRRVEQVVNGTLDKPADVALNLPEDHIDGSVKAFVKIYPSSFSQAGRWAGQHLPDARRLFRANLLDDISEHAGLRLP